MNLRKGKERRAFNTRSLGKLLLSAVRRGLGYGTLMGIGRASYLLLFQKEANISNLLAFWVFCIIMISILGSIITLIEGRESCNTFNKLAYGDDRSAEAAAQRLIKLSRYSWGRQDLLDDMVWAYGQIDEPARRDLLARTYKEITGQNIQIRLNRLMFG